MNFGSDPSFNPADMVMIYIDQIHLDKSIIINDNDLRLQANGFYCKLLFQEMTQS